MNISLAKVSDRTAALTGVSLATIIRITSEAASPETQKDQPSNQNSFDDFNQGVIRRIINTMYTQQKKIYIVTAGLELGSSAYYAGVVTSRPCRRYHIALYISQYNTSLVLKVGNS